MVDLLSCGSISIFSVGLSDRKCSTVTCVIDQISDAHLAAGL